MAAVLQYPEFLAAVLVALLLAFCPGEAGRLGWPLWLMSAARVVLELFPLSYLVWVKRLLIFADRRNNQSFSEFACSKLSLLLLFLPAALFFPLHYVLMASLAFFFLPDLHLVISVQRRQEEIRKSLPQALDLMVLCVDAGLGLEAALQRLSAEEGGMTTALNDELKILGREILLGMDRERAYQDLYNRSGVDELKTLGAALHQASKLGLSVAKILRAQSDFICKKHSQQAEEKAMKMPVYMAFPLWFFIMPSLMLLVLGPSLLRFYQTLHAGASTHF